ncbi:hypothetical protein [Pseudomonas sp. HY7a-MNA-CIBAN-0227]|uniref:hypothetical protein n=1 Tax=Pseudomonas sp. HY7a-MNA-CIBAN-0227 TaxID=3140474 RepID=UPI00332349A9
MNEQNTQVKISGETCDGSMTVELLGRMNPALIQSNPFLKGDEIQNTFNDKMQNDPDFKRDVESNLAGLQISTNAMIFLMVICIVLGLIANVTVHTINGMLHAEEDKGRYNLGRSIISYAILIVFFTVPYGPLTGAGWAGSYLGIGAEKLENLTRRGAMYFFENYVIDDKQSENLTEDKSNKNNINVEYSKAESESIITKMVIGYASMRQTDKAYMFALNSRYAKLADPATFYHYVDNRIEMYRTAPNSAVVDYTGGTHIIPTPNLDFLGDSYKKLNLEQYVTSDIGSLENNLTTARRVLMEDIGTENNNSTAIDNVVDVILLMSKREILMNYYKQIQTDGTLAAIAKELLRQACFDSMEAERSKSFLAYYKDGAAFAGNPFCLSPTDNTGANFEVVGLGATAKNMRGDADRTQQNAWFAKQMSLTQAVIDKRHSLLEQIATIRLSVALTDSSKETAQLAASSQTGFMLAGTEYLWNIEDKQRVVKSLFLGSGEQIISKGSEANLINYEFLSKGGNKAFSESGLRFGYYTQAMYAEFKRGRTSETHTMTTDTIIQNAVETSSSYSELDTAFEKALTNPIHAFYNTLGLTESCRDDTDKCIAPTTNVLKNVVELGNNLIDTSLTALIKATGVSVAARSIDLFTSSNKDEKGSVKSKSLKSGLSSGLNKAFNGINVISSFIAYMMTFVLIFGIFLAKVVPLVFNLPFLSGHLMTTMVYCIIPVAINFFGVWLALANDKDNFDSIRKKMKSMIIVLLFLPSLLTFVKILSFVSVSNFIFLIIETIYSATATASLIDEAIVLFFIGMSLLALVVTVATICWSIIGIFFRIAGLQSFLGDEPLKVVRKISDLFTKIIPGISTVREAFRKQVGNSMRKYSRK